MVQSTRHAALVSAGHPDLAGQEIELHRRRRRGESLTPYQNQWLDAMSPAEIEFFDSVADAYDEQDRHIREEIDTHQEGYTFHRDVAGGLPFDWGGDSELQQRRPDDWEEAKAWTWTTRLVKTAPRRLWSAVRPPAARPPVVRPRERRSRRAASRSSLASGDSGGDDGPLAEPPAPAPRHVGDFRHVAGFRHVSESLADELARLGRLLDREAVR